MLRFIKDVIVYLDPSDRREWLFLLGASFAGGISRSLFLATVNTAAVAIIENHYTGYYLFVPLLLALTSLGANMFGTIRGRMVAERLVIRMRTKLAQRILHTNLRFIEHEKHYELHYHLLNTVGTISSSYFTFLSFVGAAVTLTFNAIYIAWLSPVGLLISAIVAAVAVSTDWFFEQANAAERQRLDELRRRSHSAHGDLLSGFKELRLSEAKSKDFQNYIGELDREIYESSLRVGRVTATGGAFNDFFQYLAISIFGIGFALLAAIPPATVMQLISAVLFTISPLSSIVGAFPNFGSAKVALKSLKRLMASIDMATEPERYAASSRLPKFESIGLKDAMFHFDESHGAMPKAEEFVLGPINLKINRGDLVCVVGGNGSGKTIMLRLLTGLYPRTGGELLFNGNVVLSEDMKDYRDHFATVFNDFFLFKDLLGRRDTPAAVVTKWLDYFGISKKTKYVEGGFSTIELSTGQRKRLALIVGLLDKRPVLVLDEFGAEQDPEHRDQFYQLWLPYLQKMGLTIVIVSHDDAYFECADMIVRMDFGKIVECRRVEGRYCELPKAPAREPLQV